MSSSAILPKFFQLSAGVNCTEHISDCGRSTFFMMPSTELATNSLYIGGVIMRNRRQQLPVAGDMGR